MLRTTKGEKVGIFLIRNLAAKYSLAPTLKTDSECLWGRKCKGRGEQAVPRASWEDTQAELAAHGDGTRSCDQS